MASLNKVFLIGNLTRDPELRYTPNGTAVTDLGLAVNRLYNTKDGERREETLFVDVTVWNRQAETCCQYLRKGRPIHVEGYLRLDSWDDRTTGEKRTKIKVEAERVQFLDGRRDDGGTAGFAAEDDNAASNAPPQRSASDPRHGPNGPSSRSYGPSNAGSQPNPSSGETDDAEADEDIPF